MAFNKDKPASTDNYLTEFIPNIQGNVLGLAMFLDSTLSTVTGTLPLGVKRYNRTSQRFEEYSGSAWGTLSLKVTLADTATNVAYSGLTGVVPTWNQHTTGNAATATNVAYSGLTGTVPTWNQNTTGNAATATNVAYSGLTGTIPTWNQNTTGNAATASNMPYSGLTGTVPTWNQSTTGNAATATSDSQHFGIGQAWVDVTGSRAIGGGPYTNNTGKPICVSVRGNIASGGLYVYATINSVAVAFASGYTSGGTYPWAGTFCVPAGATYQVNWAVPAGSPSYSAWVELR